jgi:predicted esterase
VTDLSFVHEFEKGTDPSAPTLLLLHGTGGSEHDLLPIGRSLVPGASLLSPRGKVLERGMPRFFRRLAEGVFDLDDLELQTQDLARFLAAAAERYRFDPSRVIAVGFSNGANIAASLLMLVPGSLAGAVLFRAMVPIVPDPLPNLSGTPVLLSAGRSDPLVDPAGSEKLASLLQRCGADVTLEWQQAGHHLGAGDIETAHAWLARRPVSQ